MYGNESKNMAGAHEVPSVHQLNGNNSKGGILLLWAKYWHWLMRFGIGLMWISSWFLAEYWRLTRAECFVVAIVNPLGSADIHQATALKAHHFWSISNLRRKLIAFMFSCKTISHKFWQASPFWYLCPSPRWRSGYKIKQSVRAELNMVWTIHLKWMQPVQSVPHPPHHTLNTAIWWSYVFIEIPFIFVTIPYTLRVVSAVSILHGRWWRRGQWW